jgi:hypothetical protein
MRMFVCAVTDLPHPEERRQARLEGRAIELHPPCS